MFCSVFVFLLCLFMFSSTTVNGAKEEDFFIDFYNSSNVEEINKETIYRYKDDELLNITCHKRGQPVMKLKWLLNDQFINGTEVGYNEINLQLPINKNNDKDKLTCHASEDVEGLEKNGKIIKRNKNITLSYDVTTITTTIGPNNLKDEVKNTEDTMLQKLMKSRIFLIVVVVVIVVIILTVILGFASKRNYRIKEDEVGLHPAVSNTSVFTTGSRSTSIIPHHKIREDKVNLHSPISSGSNFNSDSRTLPLPPQRMTNNKIHMPPASSASYFNSDSRTLPLPPQRMTNVKDGMHSPISSPSYFNTGPRKPTTQHKEPEECFYTNYDYNKTHLHGSREVINEYQEPIDSQAYSYVQADMYSEPEKQFYTEPIPKILRKPKDTAYVNYNKSNGSANINRKINGYQKCEEIRDNEFDYYTEAS